MKMKKAEMRAQLQRLYDEDSTMFAALVPEILASRQPKRAGRKVNRNYYVRLAHYHAVSELTAKGISRRKACEALAKEPVRRGNGSLTNDVYASASTIEAHFREVRQLLLSDEWGEVVAMLLSRLFKDSEKRAD